MKKGILGRKIGMTQVFTQSGKFPPCPGRDGRQKYLHKLQQTKKANRYQP